MGACPDFFVNARDAPGQAGGTSETPDEIPGRSWRAPGDVLHLAGLHARDSGEARRYQSNTVRTKAVLSVWRVGLEYLRRHAGALPRHVLVATERLLCDEVYRQAQGLG